MTQEAHRMTVTGNRISISYAFGTPRPPLVILCIVFSTKTRFGVSHADSQIDLN